MIKQKMSRSGSTWGEGRKRNSAVKTLTMEQVKGKKGMKVRKA